MSTEHNLFAALAVVPADLAEAGKVLEGVTPGRWKAHHEDDYSMIVVHEPSFTQIGHLYEAVDAEFVAWTREGVPALLARIAAQEAQIKGLEAERDDADRRAGAAQRELADKRDTIGKVSQARDEMKKQRGYDYTVSFDRVWKETCEKADRAEAAETALTAMTKERDEALETSQSNWNAAKRYVDEIVKLNDALAAERAKTAKLVESWDLARSHSRVKVTLGDGDARKSWGAFLIAMDETRATITEAGHE